MLSKLLQQAAGNAGAEPLFVESVFSTYLYTGNGSTQTITNGIDLAGEGGLVWVKSRSNVSDHRVVDTVRGASKDLRVNTTDAEGTTTTGVTSFNSDGFSLGSAGGFNNSGYTFASWTFRKAEKFFDVVTWTGDGTFNNSRIINHSINATVGAIIVKATSSSGTNWIAYHRSLPASYFVFLNATNAQTQLVFAGGTYPIQDVTNTTFNVNHGGNSCNASGVTYVAYLFAHDAGGFGADGTENVISCGSFTSDGSGSTQINLGWEPQWIIFKKTTAASQWYMFDTMRGLTVYDQGNDQYLWANDSIAEGAANCGGPNSTGFEAKEAYFGSGTWVYIAIRRGPMKTPESGTEVFKPYAFTSSGVSPLTVNVGFPSDSFLYRERSLGESPFDWRIQDRIRGNNPYLETNNTDAENTWINTNDLFSSQQNSLVIKTNSSIINGNTYPYIYYHFRRAPGFFDVVCYTGTNTLRTVSHNLGVAPEFVIIKIRNSADNWETWTSYTPMSSWYRLNENTYSFTPNYFNNVSPTSTEFTLKASGVFAVNQSGYNYVAYLFATCPGVSKIGSYTGSGTTKQIDCGFTGGARFVLIKRTDSTGDWYVWDTARGIVAGNDPYLLLNSTDAEVTSTDYIDPYSAGFEISSTAPAAINASGGTFIFLAIA